MSTSRFGALGTAVRPTVRVTPLLPLSSVTIGLVVIGAAVGRGRVELPHTLIMATFGALAASVALGLDDEARSLLQPSPSSAAIRLACRLMILLPAVLMSAGVLALAGRLLFAAGSSTPALPALGALVTTGIALDVWLTRRRPDIAAEGAATVVAVWSVSASLVPDVDVLRAVTDAWHTHALVVVFTASLLAVVGASGREA